VPGRWRNSTVPYAAGILDASFFPSVQEIVVCAAPQTGKTGPRLRLCRAVVARLRGAGSDFHVSRKTPGTGNRQNRTRKACPFQAYRIPATGVVDPMNDNKRVVCFKSAEEIAEYIAEDPNKINQLVDKENLPAWKRKGIGPWRAQNIDLDRWRVEQRDKYYLNRKNGDSSK
jgi:hypothetical protein